MSDLASSVERLHTEVRRWEQPRWSRPGPTDQARTRVPGPTNTKADLVYDLVQRLADWGADAEHRPHRPVPRERDMILPDQLRVVADDLLAAGAAPDVLAAAAAAVDDLRYTI